MIEKEERVGETPERLLKYFEWRDPAHSQNQNIQVINGMFYQLARTIIDYAPSSPERTVALRHLLDSKTAIVRALIDREEGEKIMAGGGKYSFSKGPKADGKGTENISETTWQESVQGEVPSKVPGGESKSGKGIEQTGPNPKS